MTSPTPCEPDPPPASPPSAALKSDCYYTLGLSESARFFADKAAAATPTPANFLRLARHFLSSDQPRRTLTLLQSRSLHETNPSARLLYAQALFRLNQLDECLAVLGPDEPSLPPPLSPPSPSPHVINQALEHLSINKSYSPLGPEIGAALCVLRARVYEAMDNAPTAVLWYKRALVADIYCVEAFHALTQSGLVTRDQAARYVSELLADPARLPEEPLAKWLLEYYTASIDSAHPLPEITTDVDNIDVLSVQARRLYDMLDFSACVDVCKRIVNVDPYVDGSFWHTYLAALVELDERQQLFVIAHSLVDNQPKCAVSWMAVGYYYYACEKPEVARRFLHKATTLDGRLAPAWVAVGHAFGAQDESDQAMAAYRTASRLFPGAQLPMLFMGIEYARQSSLGHATMLFQSAMEACPTDPAPPHELGVVAYRHGDMARAVTCFRKALALWGAKDEMREIVSPGGRRAEAEEATLFNLGHCYRRLRDFKNAKRCYERALGLSPRSASTCAALGMTLHAMMDVDGAVAMYHRALRFSPEDANCAELLERALLDRFLVVAEREKRGELEGIPMTTVTV